MTTQEVRHRPRQEVKQIEVKQEVKQQVSQKVITTVKPELSKDLKPKVEDKKRIPRKSLMASKGDENTEEAKKLLQMQNRYKPSKFGGLRGKSQNQKEHEDNKLDENLNKSFDDTNANQNEQQLNNTNIKSNTSNNS